VSVRGLGIGWWSVVFDLMLPIPQDAAQHRRASFLATEASEALRRLGRSLAIAGAMEACWQRGYEASEADFRALENPTPPRFRKFS
jgi:hypothetical protein